MRGGAVGFLTLIAGGVILADLLTHPTGTAAGLNGLNGILKTSFSAALGGKKISG
jgi:hypothetical protein